MFDAIEQDVPTHATEISRFTAIAASFATESDMLRFLGSETTAPAHVILTQLLFEPPKMAVILRMLPTQDSHAALVRIVRSQSRLKRVLARSHAFAERLTRYLQATIAPAPGDTLMLGGSRL